MFDSSPPASQPKSDTGHVFGTESSFDFASLSTTSAAGSSAAGPTTSAASPPPAAAGQAGNTNSSQPSTSQAPAADSHDWDALFAGLESAATPTASSHGLDATSAAAGGNENGSVKEARPTAPGRALTEEGEHDDPILKNLTGMGYARKEALAALEKYDYDLERVSFFL